MAESPIPHFFQLSLNISLQRLTSCGFSLSLFTQNNDFGMKFVKRYFVLLDFRHDLLELGFVSSVGFRGGFRNRAYP